MTRILLAAGAVPLLAIVGLLPQQKSIPKEAPAAGPVPGAERGDEHFSPAWHAGRRKALVERVAARRPPTREAASGPESAPAPEKPGVVVLRGAPARRDYKRFRQTNDFFYLTGVDAPGAALVIRVRDGRATLFLAPMEAGEGVWLDVRPHAPRAKAEPKEGAASRARRRGGDGDGGEDFQAKAEALARKLGFEDLRESDGLEDFLASLADEGPFFTPLAPEEYEATSRDDASSFEASQARDGYDGRRSRSQQFKARLEEKHGASVRDLTPFLDRLRRLKTPEEIEAMRVASKIASAGHIAAMRATRPGLKEWQIGAEATAVFYRAGAPDISYFPIVGTGRNALILHYTDTGATVAPDDVILMDYAPEWHFYASDVTRSWPASGKFTPAARKIYEAVLKSQEAAIAAVKPGSTFGQVNQAAMQALQEAGFAPMMYMPHGLSHPIGMTTHDVGGLGKLEPGLVFTIEPGIYDRKSGIGVRIEDVVAVTEGGCDVLSRDCPKQVAEIEAIVGKPAR